MSKVESGVASLITSRRTIHDFKPEPKPDSELIKEAVSVASWAPNHHLSEPWHFYLLGEETVTSICELNKTMLTETKGLEAAEKKYTRWMAIPGWLLVTCQKSDDAIRYQEDYAACCCAIQNLMLFLQEKGVGTKWSTGPVTRDERFYELVWVNEELENIVGLIWYGYPEDIPQTLRKPIQQILTELP